MQRFLRDILNDPPYNLVRFANFLLVVCVVLLGSIFLLHTEGKDITLNLSIGSEQEELVAGRTQLATFASEQLYPFIEEGQELERGDTMFIGMSLSQFKEINTWIEKLNAGKLIPTKEMLNKYSVPRDVRTKMIDIAKQDALNKKLSRNKLNIEDADRMIRVKEMIAQLQLDEVDLIAAIPKFKGLEKKAEAKFFNEREKHARSEISLEQLRKEKDKLDEAEGNTKIRIDQLRRTQGLLFEYRSELNKLTDKKPATKKVEQFDLVPFEQDLARSLDSMIKSQVVISQISGTVKSFGKLKSIQAGDILVYLKPILEKVNRSNIVIADASRVDAKHISLNAISNIILKDGSSVQGTIEGLEEGEQGEGSVVRINSKEEVSYTDIEEIIVPANNSNFIQRVLQNF